MTCPAIDHGVAIFPDGKIRPCCQVSADYSKPLSEISNPDRFADLRGVASPVACDSCNRQKNQGLPSYKQFFMTKFDKTKSGIQFLDFRHSNQCNLKCRYCNPHFSNQWAHELGHTITLKQAPVEQHYEHLLTDSLTDIYWCGGEPLIIKEHFDVLEKLINRNLSGNINLRYNTNFTTIQYKDKNLISLWTKFKSVRLAISLDVAGPELDYIRSGSKWDIVSNNIETVLLQKETISNLSICFATTLSLLNVWFLPELYQYAQSKNIPVELALLHGPDYLSLSAIHGNELKEQAREKLSQIKTYISEQQFNSIIDTMNADDNEYLFTHAIRHILLLDSIRNEKLFDLLPFKKLALTLTAENKEYE